MLTHPSPCLTVAPEAYETYARVATVVADVVNQSYVDLLEQLSNPWILASMDFSETEIAAFFDLLGSTKITVEFTNSVDAQPILAKKHHTLQPKLLNRNTHQLCTKIAIDSEIKV